MAETNKQKLNIWALAGITSACLISAVVGSAMTRWFEPSKFTVSYVDFISIILTALGVLITVLGIFIAVLSIIGWRSIEDKLRDHSFNYVGNQLKEGQPLHDLIMSTVQEVAYKGVRPVDDDETFVDPEAPGK